MNDWKKEAYRMVYDENISYQDAGKTLFPDMETVRAGWKVRDYIRTTDRYKSEHTTTSINPVGVFGDIHAPFNHPNYLQFIQDTFKKYGVKEIVCTGDIIDHHALSRFQSSTSAKGATDEKNAAQSELDKYFKAFPKVKMCIGNHDNIFERQAATLGIGKEFLKSLEDVYHMPKGWEIAEEYIINDVLYKHGINCLGKDGAINTAITERMSTVIGHAHSFGGVKYSANKRSIIFGMNVGCGIDIDAYAFEYGKYAKNRPTLGCGIVFDSTCAIFVPMSSDYFRSAEGR